MVIVIGWQVYDIARETMGISEAAFQLGLIGLVQFVPLFAADADHRLDRRPARPAPHRPGGRSLLELFCALVAVRRDLARIHQPADPVRGRGAARRRARLRRARRFGALAPNLVPREILPRAIALTSTAWQTGRDRRPGASAAYLYDVTPHLPYARERSPVRLLGRLPVHRSARSPRRRSEAGQPAEADGRRPVLRPPQPARARRDHPRPVRRAARRSDGDAAGLRARHPPGRRGRPRPACAPRRQSARR